MEKLPLVSIITITRNRGKLIGRCIQSVLNQTYKNIEHIVVDGASDDETDEVVASFKDKRLKYIKLANNWTIARTINYGVEQSNGLFITFLDSDDEYLPTKIEKQLNKMLTLPNDYGMVYCWMTYYDQSTMKIDHIHNPKVRGDVSKEVVEKPVVSGTPSYFFRREAFIANGGWKEADEIGIVSDWEMGARFCQKWKVDYVPESLINVYFNHGIVRMSENKYYKNILEKEIKFEKHFLSQFADIYAKSPSKAFPHWYMLCRALMILGRYSEAWPYYKQLLFKRHSFKDIFLIPFCLLHKAE